MIIRLRTSFEREFLPLKVDKFERYDNGFKKTEKKNLKKFSESGWDQYLSLEFCHVTQLKDLEKLRGSVRSLNSENDKMNSKHLKTIKNFKNLAKIVILLSSEPFHCLQRPSIIPIASLE